MSDPSDEKAQPQIQPDAPPRKDEPEIEDPELASGQFAHRDQEDSTE